MQKLLGTGGRGILLLVGHKPEAAGQAGAGNPLAKRQGRPPKYPPVIWDNKTLDEPRMGKGRSMKKVMPLDYEGECFGDFLGRNFKGSLAEFCSWLLDANSDTCSYIHHLYGDELEAKRGEILTGVGWRDVLAMGKKGNRPFDRVGANVNNVLGLGMRSSETKNLAAMQAAVMCMFGSLGEYLAFREGGDFTTPQEAFVRFMEDLGISARGANAKHAPMCALQKAFGKNVEKEMAAAIFENLGWTDPIKILHGGPNCPKNRGYLVSRMLGIKVGGGAGEGLRKGENAQEYVFKTLYAGMDDYLDRCHGGSYENFGEAVMALPNQTARRAFCTAFRKAFAKEIAVPSAKIKIAEGFGMPDPLDVYLKTGTDDGWARMLAAIRLFGWEMPESERKDNEVRNRFFEGIARLHRDFDGYVERFYGGDAGRFAESLMARAKGECKTHFARRLKKAFGGIDSEGRHTGKLTQAFFGREPLLLSQRDVYENGGAFAHLTGQRAPLRMQAVFTHIFRLHRSFSAYLAESHNGSLWEWLGRIGQMGETARNAYLGTIRKAYPSLRVPHSQERDALLSQLAHIDPLLFEIGRTVRSGENYLGHKTLALCRVFGSGKRSELEVRAILLSRCGSIEGYIREYHGGDAGTYLARIGKQPGIKKHHAGQAILLAFRKNNAEWDALESLQAADRKQEYTCAIPEKMNQGKAVSLFFDKNMLDQMGIERKPVPGRSEIAMLYAYRDLVRNWIGEKGRSEQPAEPLLAEALSLALKNSNSRLEASVAKKAVEVCWEKTRGDRREGFVRNELPALLRLLESFFGSGAPHALAVLARMKYAESRDDNDSFRNEWQEMASQFREYLSAIGKNMVIVLESNGFSKSGADGPVCYRRAFEGKRNESVAAIFDTRAREMLFFVNGERVRGGDVLWRGDLRFVEEICQFLDGYSPDLVAFAEAMAARIRGDAAGA